MTGGVGEAAAASMGGAADRAASVVTGTAVVAAGLWVVVRALEAVRAAAMAEASVGGMGNGQTTTSPSKMPEVTRTP